MAAIYYCRSQKRLWLFERRVHHGFTGCALTLIGLLLITHDRADRSVWFRFERLS